MLSTLELGSGSLGAGPVRWPGLLGPTDFSALCGRPLLLRRRLATPISLGSAFINRRVVTAQVKCQLSGRAWTGRRCYPGRHCASGHLG